jgi:hypothetical protein
VPIGGFALKESETNLSALAFPAIRTTQQQRRPAAGPSDSGLIEIRQPSVRTVCGLTACVA